MIDDNLPPGVTQDDIDKHLEGFDECEDEAYNTYLVDWKAQALKEFEDGDKEESFEEFMEYYGTPTDYETFRHEMEMEGLERAADARAQELQDRAWDEAGW